MRERDRESDRASYVVEQCDICPISHTYHSRIEIHDNNISNTHTQNIRPLSSLVELCYWDFFNDFVCDFFPCDFCGKLETRYRQRWWRWWRWLIVVIRCPKLGSWFVMMVFIRKIVVHVEKWSFGSRKNRLRKRIRIENRVLCLSTITTPQT